MATINKPKRLWLLIKRYDLCSDDELPSEEILDVTIKSYTHPDRVQSALRESLGLQDDGLILKLRNNRGSLVPINSNLMPNSKSVPYVLEVVRIHQYIQPLPRTVTHPKYNEMLKHTMRNFVQRIEILEGYVPHLKERRRDKIISECEDLDRKLVFLNKRFNEAENKNWQGMFKKQPLW